METFKTAASGRVAVYKSILAEAGSWYMGKQVGFSWQNGLGLTMTDTRQRTAKQMYARIK